MSLIEFRRKISILRHKHFCILQYSLSDRKIPYSFCEETKIIVYLANLICLTIKSNCTKKCFFEKMDGSHDESDKRHTTHSFVVFIISFINSDLLFKVTSFILLILFLEGICIQMIICIAPHWY